MLSTRAAVPIGFHDVQVWSRTAERMFAFHPLEFHSMFAPLTRWTPLRIATTVG